MDKRLRKLSNLPKTFKNPIYVNAVHEEADLLVVGVNSTRGTIEEAMPRLEADGVKVNLAQIRLLHPFPKDELKALMDKAKKVVVVENNATAQLATIIKMNVGGEKIENVLKYDGNPFLPAELHQVCKELV
jgi:2-oxoglutarate ferredoxin oxidoreductase subunit alpha